MNPVEQSHVADTSALVLVLKELDPVLDVLEVALTPEVLRKREECLSACVARCHVLRKRTVLDVLNASIEALVCYDVLVAREDEFLVSQVLRSPRGVGQDVPLSLVRVVEARAVPGAHLLVDVDLLVDVETDCELAGRVVKGSLGLKKAKFFSLSDDARRVAAQLGCGERAESLGLAGDRGNGIRYRANVAQV